MIRTARILSLIMLFAADGCSSSSSPVSPIAATPLPVPTATATPTPIATAIAATTSFLYVGNRKSNAITIYRADAGGNTAPLRVISGSKTGLSTPGQIAQDAGGNLYVANGSYVTVYATGAAGNVAPIRTLTGPAPGLNDVLGLAVDKISGDVFVMTYSTNEVDRDVGLSQLSRFAAGANGAQAPDAESDSSLDPPTGLALDSSDQNIISAHIGFDQNKPFQNMVSTYSKNFTNGEMLPALDAVELLGPRGIADDPTTHTYLVTGSRPDTDTDGLYRIPENATDLSSAIVITSDTGGTQVAVGTGAKPYTYVTHSAGGTVADAIRVYANGSSGNVIPLRTLSGAATELNDPYGVYVGQ